MVTNDGGCVENVTQPVGFHQIGAAEVQLANQLLASNGIASSNVRYLQYQRDTLERQYPPYERVGVKIVKLQEYANGLLVFTSYLNYLFHDGVFHVRVGEPTGGTTLNATPRLRLWQVRGLFLQAAEEFDHNSASWRSICFGAELGYYNLNAGTGTETEKLVLAWRISPRGREYPVAYVQDQSGELIYYFNGRVSFTR